MMNIAILEDDAECRRGLEAMLSRYCQMNLEPGTTQIRQFSDDKALLAAFEEENFDIAFIDIYIENSGDVGMQAARRLHSQNSSCAIIFTTQSTDHAVESYQVRAFDYLLKPFTYEKLENTMNLCCKHLEKARSHIRIKEGRIYTNVLVSDIIYTDYYNHYIQIYLKDRMLRCYMPFADFYELLKPYPNFLNCYRNCLINMEKVDYIEDRDFVMIGGSRVPIAKSSRQELLQRYADYVFEKNEGAAGI